MMTTKKKTTTVIMTIAIEEDKKLIAVERKFSHAEVSGGSTSKTPGKEESKE